jgi:hypothetical protein
MTWPLTGFLADYSKPICLNEEQNIRRYLPCIWMSYVDGNASLVAMMGCGMPAAWWIVDWNNWTFRLLRLDSKNKNRKKKTKPWIIVSYISSHHKIKEKINLIVFLEIFDDKLTIAVFRSRKGWPESALRATVFPSEHGSVFCFLVQKIV